MATGKLTDMGPSLGAARSMAVLALVGCTALGAGATAAQQPMSDVAPAAVLAPNAAAAHRVARTGIAGRVQLLTRELGLDTQQEQAVAALLAQQRTSVARVWSDPSVPAALRVGATQAIGDRTAEQIRALLNEEQRKRYLQPRQHDAPVGAPGGDVQKWMQSAQGLEPSGMAAAKGD